MSFFPFLLWKKFFFFWNWTNHIVIENLQKMCNSPFHLLKELIIVFDFLNRAILGTRYLLYNSWHLLACFKTHFRYFRIKNFQLKKISQISSPFLKIRSFLLIGNFNAHLFWKVIIIHITTFFNHWPCCTMYNSHEMI